MVTGAMSWAGGSGWSVKLRANFAGRRRAEERPIAGRRQGNRERSRQAQKLADSAVANNAARRLPGGQSGLGSCWSAAARGAPSLPAPAAFSLRPGCYAFAVAKNATADKRRWTQ